MSVSTVPAGHTARLTVIGGGVRSGKSAFALSLAKDLGERRVFVATAQAFDSEMQARIGAHVAERGRDFRTIEEPFDLPGCLGAIEGADVVVVDCLTLWLSNLLLRDVSPAAIEKQVERLAEVVAQRPFRTIVVTNEVGMGIVPDSPLGRAFRDVAGRAHQQLVRRADQIYMAVLGAILRLAPGPIALVQPAGLAALGATAATAESAGEGEQP